tara:strand:- start:995 stop:1618 length:624 start_codon:yes stop_codon:yes gene_type:complete
MINLNSNYNTGSGYLERTSIYGCSFSTPYIPIFAVYKNSDSDFSKINNEMNIIWHHKYPLGGNYSIGNKYDDLYRAFKTFTSPILWKNKSGEYYVRKGMVYTKNFEILCSICFVKNKLQLIDKQNPNYNDMVMVINKKFDSIKHKLLYRRFYKDVINPLENLDTIYTNDPNKYCFNIPKLIPKFGNLEQMNGYLNNVNNELCLRNGI